MMDRKKILPCARQLDLSHKPFISFLQLGERFFTRRFKVCTVCRRMSCFKTWKYLGKWYLVKHISVQICVFSDYNGKLNVSACTGNLQVVLGELNLRSYYKHSMRTWCRDFYTTCARYAYSKILSSPKTIRRWPVQAEICSCPFTHSLHGAESFLRS